MSSLRINHTQEKENVGKKCAERIGFDISKSIDTDRLLATAILGNNNDFFAVSFSDELNVIIDRAFGAFTPGDNNFEVLTDTFLFSATIVPLLNSTYTFGTRQESFAPDIEVPEPTTAMLLAAGLIAGVAVRIRRRRRASENLTLPILPRLLGALVGVPPCSERMRRAEVSR